jgi:AraC-like DNA-binding protein
VTAPRDSPLLRGIRAAGCPPATHGAPPDGPRGELLGRLAADGPVELHERLLAATLGNWSAGHRGTGSVWAADLVVGSALDALHADPARPWTVADLAAGAGVAATDLGRRFREVTGIAPLTYLRRFRMRVAAEYLAEPSATVAAVARRVGYADPFSFCTVFTQECGISPGEVRGSRPRT